MDGARIVGLHVQNVKAIRAVELSVDTDGGGLVIVSGKNAQGKSSLLDSIEYAMCGKRSVPEEPIRRGNRKGVVEVTIDGPACQNGPWKITRTFTHGNQSLKIQAAGNNQFANPQALLDAFQSDFTFDPLEFLHLDSKRQREVLLQTVDLPIDLEANAADTERLFGQRRDVNRDVKRLEGAVSEYADVTDEAPDKIETTAVVVSDLNAAQARERELANAREDLLILAQRAKDAKAAVKAAREALKTAEAIDVDASADHQSHGEVVKELQANASQAEKEGRDSASIRKRLDSLEERKEQARRKQQKARIAQELAQAQSTSEALTHTLDALRQERSDALTGATFPIQGLEVDDESVLFHGFPLNQASQAEQLRVSVGIAMALNPTLRVLRIKDGSLLDKDGMQELAESAHQMGYDIWIERVAEGEPVGIVIEDGMLLEAGQELLG